MTAAWTITWSHSSAEIQPLGGMLGPVWCALPSGPFFVAPWVDEPGAADLPGLLRGLRGEWPCVPFGAERDMAIAGWEGAGPAIGDGAPHGHGSNHAWHLIDRGPDWIEIGIDYPDGHPIRRLRRKIAGRAGAAALDLELGIEAARAAYDLGQAVSADPANPLASAGFATSWPLRAQERFTTTYALSVEDLA